MLEYLIILLVIAVALVPLSHFRPSKRQRHIAAMREAAAVQGLFVEFRRLPGPEGRIRAPQGDIIYYGLRLPASAKGEITAGYWLKHADGWRAGQSPRALPEVFHALPDVVLAASIDVSSCGIYWVESSQEDDVARISAMLRAWKEQLFPLPTAP